MKRSFWLSVALAATLVTALSPLGCADCAAQKQIVPRTPPPTQVPPPGPKVPDDSSEGGS